MDIQNKDIKMVKVSITVPVYNVEKYLEKCLDSLIGQTLKDIEIICINDGSTDNSLSILEKYAKKDSRIKIINQENQGIANTRNKSIKLAQGEYIGFVDSDDWVSCDFFEKLYNAALKYEADIAAAGIIRATDKHEKMFLEFKKETVTNNTDKKFEICDIPDKSYVCNKIYKLSKIRYFGLKFKNDVTYEDIIFTPEAVHKLGTLVTVPDTYYFYYKRQGSITNTKSNKNNHSYAVEIANKYFKENNIDIEFHRTKICRFKICNLTIFKTKRKGDLREAILFNIIKWRY